MSKSPWREYQDAMDNNGWRIKLIHPGDPNRVRWHKTQWGGLAFAMLFLYGVMTKNIRVILSGMAGMPLAIFVESLIRYGYWKRVAADVIDIEFGLGMSMNPKVRGHAWSSRMLCRYCMNGKAHEVTPMIPGVSADFFPKDAPPDVLAEHEKKEIQRIYSMFIGENRVRLYVNTREPLEAKLDNGSFASRIIHALSKKIPSA